MIKLVKPTPSEIDFEIAQRLKKIRRRRKITQRQLAARSGVSYGSLKRFEQTGEISLSALTMLAFALGVEEELGTIFTKVPFLSIEEVIREQNETS